MAKGLANQPMLFWFVTVLEFMRIVVIGISYGNMCRM